MTSSRRSKAPVSPGAVREALSNRLTKALHPGAKLAQAELDRLRVLLEMLALGLGWTPYGGDVVFVEVCRMPGAGELTLTGSLGDVMKQSDPGGRVVGPGERRAVRPGTTRSSGRRICTCTSGGRGAEGRGLGRGSRW